MSLDISQQFRDAQRQYADRQEEWRDVRGYGGRYRISKSGRIQQRSITRPWTGKWAKEPMALRPIKFGKWKDLKATDRVTLTVPWDGIGVAKDSIRSRRRVVSVARLMARIWPELQQA